MRHSVQVSRVGFPYFFSDLLRQRWKRHQAATNTYKGVPGRCFIRHPRRWPSQSVGAPGTDDSSWLLPQTWTIMKIAFLRQFDFCQETVLSLSTLTTRVNDRERTVEPQEFHNFACVQARNGNILPTHPAPPAPTMWTSQFPPMAPQTTAKVPCAAQVLVMFPTRSRKLKTKHVTCVCPVTAIYFTCPLQSSKSSPKFAADRLQSSMSSKRACIEAAGWRWIIMKPVQQNLDWE